MRAEFPESGALPGLNFEALDNEHRALARFLASLYQAIVGRSPVSEQRLVLHELLSFLRVHCAHEEQLMRSCEYPDRQGHSASHQALYQRLEWLDEILLRAATSGALEALRETTALLFAHVNWEDRRIVEWHQKRSSSQA